MMSHYAIRTIGVLEQLGHLVKQRIPKNLNFDKKDLIDFTFQRIKPKLNSFADLAVYGG
ncbi:MAG: hypothetical protein ACFFCW_46555 [Candidatus Hodarchaeota archaeon]